MLRRLSKVLIVGCLLCYSASAHTQVIASSTFDTSLDGWTAVDRDPTTEVFTHYHATPKFVGSGGNPGGFIQTSDGDGDFYWRAPAKFLGNVSAAYNYTFEFDLISDLKNKPAPSSNNGVILSGGGVTLTGVFFPVLPVANVWTHISVMLNEQSGWIDFNTKQPATKAQMQIVLSSLDTMDILAEYGDGPDTGGLDNVRLTMAPSRNITGSVTLESAVNAVQSVSFTFRPNNGGPNFARTATLNADKTFSLTGIPGNAYTVHIKGTKWLAKNVSVDATNSDVSGVTATLKAGDANGDNVVDIGDFGVLVNAYNGDRSVSGSGYDPAADFNDDGVVDVGDFGILVNNYNLSGDL